MANTAKLKSIFFSDCHLGLSESHADLLTDFLEENPAQNIFILGDLIDLWVMKLRIQWPTQNMRLIYKLFDLSKSCNVIYIPGNHDALIKKFAGRTFDGIKISYGEEEYQIGDKRFLLTHGDKFDTAVKTFKSMSILGTWLYDILLWFNPLVGAARKLFGYRGKWSLSSHIIMDPRGTEYIKGFETLISKYAKKMGFDGVICGHIHQPKRAIIDGVYYYNCGDLINTQTLLVEKLDNELEIRRL